MARIHSPAPAPPKSHRITIDHDTFVKLGKLRDSNKPTQDLGEVVAELVRELRKMVA